MPATQPSAGPQTRSTHSEPYVPIEEVARRLDLPLGVLRRRAEAGDIPARREEGPAGVTYSVRLSDLGLEPEQAATSGVEAPPVDGAARHDAGTSAGEPDSVAGVDVMGSAQGWQAGQAGVERSRASDEVVPFSHPTPPSDAAGLAPPLAALQPEPRSEVSQMVLDPRELVAGLLDRWERTLEQRIYAEQRQRFEAELNARQNLVKQLQLELQAVRAENAATLAEKDRRLSEQDRRLEQLQQELAETRDAAMRRRGWLFRH